MTALCPSPLASYLAGRYSMNKYYTSNRYLCIQTLQKASFSAHKQQPRQLQHSQMLYSAISWVQAAPQSRIAHLWGRRKGAGTCVRYSSPGGQLEIEGGIGIQAAPSMVGWFWTGGTNPPGNPMGCAWNP